jgi:carboxymethylenebutenolidase
MHFLSRPLISAACLLFLLAACRQPDHPRVPETAAADAEADTLVLVFEPSLPVDGQRTVYGIVEGITLMGYLAEPAREDSILAAYRMEDQALPAVILIHDEFGLTHDVEAEAHRLAGQGFRVLAVDLFRGETSETPEMQRQHVNYAQRNAHFTGANLVAAARYLQAEHGTRRIGLMGWGAGASFALSGAHALGEDVDAVVLYYGTPDVPSGAALEAPVLAVYGERHERYDDRRIERFGEGLREFHPESRVVRVPGTYGFAHPARETFDERGAHLAWVETVQFLETHLFRPSPVSGGPRGEVAARAPDAGIVTP